MKEEASSEAQPTGLAPYPPLAWAYQALLSFIHLRRMISGITAFLLATAAGTILWDLRTGFAFGLVGWFITSVVFMRANGRIIKAVKPMIEQGGKEWGIQGDVVMALIWKAAEPNAYWRTFWF